jgi:hypothetical protein
MLKISVKGIGDTEHYRKRQNSIGGSLIAKAALGSSAVEKGIRVVQQGLHGRGRRNPGGAGLDGEHTLLVRQSDEGNGQPVTLGQSLRRLAGIRCGDPSLAGLTICWTAAGASAWASAKLRTASQTSAYDRARMRSRKTSFRGDSRSSPRRAMTSRYVVPLDEQREQHEAGGENRNKALDLRIEPAVLGDRQRQNQGQRAAQSAPSHCELIGVPAGERGYRLEQRVAISRCQQRRDRE